MSYLTSADVRPQVVIQIGGMSVSVASDDSTFLRMLKRRYAGFVTCSGSADCCFDVDLVPLGFGDPNVDLHVGHRSGQWTFERGDFYAEWDSASRTGKIRLSPNPYSIDALLRILHTLILADEGGFLLHAASAIRNDKAFLFTGASGAGKTTMVRLAPSDARLLTDEISCVRKDKKSYLACGTPFAGELSKLGEDIAAPLAAVYVLAKGLENRVDPLSAAEAVGAMLPNLLFFAKDRKLVEAVFHSACEFAGRVPVFRLTFLPDSRVWEIIQ